MPPKDDQLKNETDKGKKINFKPPTVPNPRLFGTQKCNARVETGRSHRSKGHEGQRRRVRQSVCRVYSSF